MSQATDKELIIQILKHKGQSYEPFRLLVQRYEPLVYSFCVRYLRNSEQAEDITQDTFLKAHHRLSSIDKPEQFKSWILRIASNLCTDHYRKVKRRQDIQKQVEQELNIRRELPEDDRADKVEKLKEAIEMIKESEKSIIMLHYFSELSIKEIAADLEIGESAVKMRLSRAREKLGEIIKRNL